jgi:hypothetical protein
MCHFEEVSPWRTCEEEGSEITEYGVAVGEGHDASNSRIDFNTNQNPQNRLWVGHSVCLWPTRFVISDVRRTRSS